MKTFTLSYLATLATMVGLDAIWLTATAEPLYRARLGPMLLPVFQPVAIIAFYLLYVAGLVILVVLPALTVASASAARRFALSRGALLGAVAYATYDLTNQATLRGWSTTITLADMAWGTILGALAATGGLLAARAAMRR